MDMSKLGFWAISNKLNWSENEQVVELIVICIICVPFLCKSDFLWVTYFYYSICDMYATILISFDMNELIFISPTGLPDGMCVELLQICEWAGGFRNPALCHHQWHHGKSPLLICFVLWHPFHHDGPIVWNQGLKDDGGKMTVAMLFLSTDR